MVEPMLDAAGTASLRQALAGAGYTTAGLAAARRDGGPEPGSPLDTLLQLFEYGRRVPADRPASALAPLTLDQATAAGVIENDPDGARAAVYLQPYLQWWALADLPRKLRPGQWREDHVVEVGQVPAVLARAVVRDPVRTALDLSCGSGVQSLHLSAHGEVVTASDLSPRALTFAATNAALNGLDWRLVCGNLLEPIAGQRFDLVVCNPPFIIGPGSVDYLYRRRSARRSARRGPRRRRSQPAQPGWLPAVHGRLGAWFGRHDWLRDHDLLASRFRAVDGLRLQSTANLYAGAWQNDRHQLTTPTGPRRTDLVSDLIVTIVTGCDGSLPLGEQLVKVAAQLGVDSAELRAAAVPAVTQLIEHHIIEPVPLDPSEAGLSRGRMQRELLP